MTRYVCPKNGEMVTNCPTCRRTHVHLREEEVRKGSKQVPTCSLHRIDLVPAKEDR